MGGWSLDSTCQCTASLGRVGGWSLDGTDFQYVLIFNTDQESRMGGWVGASDKASTGRAEKARVGGVGDTENHRLKTFELYRQAKVRNPAADPDARMPSFGVSQKNAESGHGNRNLYLL